MSSARHFLFARGWKLSVLVAALCVVAACDEEIIDEELAGNGDVPSDKPTEAPDPAKDCDPCPADGLGNQDRVCAGLLARTCVGCEKSPSCAAATLLAQYESERCLEAEQDEQTFPSCTASACSELMNRVCGGTAPREECADNPGCPPATVLWGRATSSEATTAEIAAALSSCATALTDESVFAPCEP
jgi:hypothetical protein